MELVAERPGEVEFHAFPGPSAAADEGSGAPNRLRIKK